MLDVGCFQIVIGLIVLLTFVAAGRGAGLEFPPLWQTDLQTFLESSGLVADLKGDGRQEALMAGREELIALDGQGKVLWRWRTKGRFMTYPAVLIRPPQASLIYAADNSGLLTCLDGMGKEVWHAQLGGPSSWSASVVCDLKGNGDAEVIQTDETGTVWAFAALTGKVLWQTKLKGIPVSPAVGDLDGDGKPEIVVATGQGTVTALNGSGNVLWERTIGGASQSWSTAAPVIFAGSDGRGRVAASSSDGQLFCLDAKGEVLWRKPTRGAVASSISVGDLDLDGRADICLVTQTGVIYRFDEDGRGIWEIDMQGRSLAPGAIIDLDGDGKPEYLLSTQGGLLLALNDQGEFLYRFQFNNRTINVTPTFGRLSADSPRLEMLITGGESGIAFCLRTPAATNCLAQWTCYRGDVRNSGSWFGLRQSAGVRMSPDNLAADQVLTGQSVRFAVQNPQTEKQPLTATAICVRPDGARQVTTAAVLARNGELLMPLDVTAPGTYQFSWTLADAGGRTLASGGRSLFLQPFANDRAVVTRALVALRAAADAAEPALPLSATALRREATSLEAEARAAAPLQDSLPGSGDAEVQTALSKSSALVLRAKRAAALAGVIRQATALSAGTSLVAFEGTLWENRKVDEQLPAQAANPLHVTRRAVPGEHEPVSLKLFNVTDRELLVRVQFDALTNGIVVVPHRSVGVPTSLGEVAWDALPELDESGTLTIPSLASRELWLDVDLAAAKPGEHQVKLRLQALNGAGVLEATGSAHTIPPTETAVEIALHLADFTLVPAGDFRMCTWGAPEAAQLPDMLAHGNNVFTVSLPSAKYDALGHLTGSDYAALDQVLGRLHGKDVVLLLTGMPNLHGEPKSDAYRADLKTFLDELVTHMAGAGFDTKHFALYPFDEPGGTGWSPINQIVELGKLVRAINPEVMMYVDGGGELSMFQAIAPYIDVWCPPINMLTEKTPVMDVVRKHGKMLWSYDCGYGYSRPVGANLKNMNLVGNYRNAALFAFRHNATGIGYWCYNLGGDPWGRVDMEYMLVYPGRTKPITSRRWEAVREGIEDYRIAAALRKRLAEDAGGSVSAAARARIERLFQVSLPGLLDQSYAEAALGLGRNVIDASNNDATVNAFRSEMLECVEAVAAGKAK
jgi:outer membrane protein assembly factor BamB